MKDLQKIEKIPGCYSYFLATASKYLDCQKNIRNVKLPVAAEEVNTCYEAARLSAFKVKYIWVEIRERWKAWTEIVNCFGSGSDIINWHSGTIDPKEERDWDWILRLVPDAVIFKDKNFSLVSQVQVIFSESNVRSVKKLKENRGSDEGSSSSDLVKAEKKEIKELMSSLNNVEGLNESFDLVIFCKKMFEDKACRKIFKALISDAAKVEFVEDEYELYRESLQPPPVL